LGKPGSAICGETRRKELLNVDPDADCVTSLLESSDLPETASVRIQRGGDPGEEQAIGIAIVEQPGQVDEPVPAGPDNDVFLAPDVAGCWTIGSSTSRWTMATSPSPCVLKPSSGGRPRLRRPP
jgi:hypothetical protein